MPIYMQIEGGKVEGESKDDGHEKWIDILSMSGAVSNNGTFAMGGGGGRGRSLIAAISVIVTAGKASPGLIHAWLPNRPGIMERTSRSMFRSLKMCSA